MRPNSIMAVHQLNKLLSTQCGQEPWLLPILKNHRSPSLGVTPYCLVKKQYFYADTFGLFYVLSDYMYVPCNHTNPFAHPLLPSPPLEGPCLPVVNELIHTRRQCPRIVVILAGNRIPHHVQYICRPLHKASVCVCVCA